MSLNCLICQSVPRTDSTRDPQEGYGKAEKVDFSLCLGGVERSWSGNLAPRPYEKMRSGGPLSSLPPTKKVKKSLHRIRSSSATVSNLENGQPRLVRSSGMRRDWSFEDLMQIVN